MAETEGMFESVRQRFVESVEALALLRERLDSLISAEQHQAEVSQSITEAASQLRQTASALGAATGTAQSAMAELDSTLAAATEFLKGTELSELRASVASLQENVGRGIVGLREDTRRIQDQLLNHIQELQQERDNAQSALAASQQRIDELEKHVAAMPDRQRRKYGFD